MPSKVVKSAMNLKQFMLRQEVLKLYRDIHRSLRQVPDEKTRQELREWARSDFRNNMQVADEFTIKRMLSLGKKSLQDVQNSLALSSTQINK
ncbi:complex 1 protein (LYR family) domain-containing protein [Phthorimaea operculella]|nr:complex 1 protein (LYR family) domain-containing protein [Phthorimaea operculella]